MTSRKHRSRAWAVVALVAVTLTGSLAASAAAEIPPDAANHPLLQPLDEQNWVDQAELTWDAYKQIRPAAWNDASGSSGSQSQYRTAVILLHFEDQPFLITQPPGTHPFGNPQPGWQPVAPEEVADWYHDYYAVPNQYNGGQTLHGYWMEQLRPIGVSVELFGRTRSRAAARVRHPRRQLQRRRARFARRVTVATRTSALTGNLWRAHRLSLGPVWLRQRLLRDGRARRVVDLAGVRRDALRGPRGHSRRVRASAQRRRQRAAQRGRQPDAELGRHAIRRLASWKAAANHWPNAGGGTSTQAESSGLSVFAHEFSHLRGLPDNYNNPFADNERNFTGYWEMMSRGTFNGPGGTHNRWQVPNQGGSGSARTTCSTSRTSSAS